LKTSKVLELQVHYRKKKNNSQLLLDTTAHEIIAAKN